MMPNGLPHKRDKSSIPETKQPSGLIAGLHWSEWGHSRSHNIRVRRVRTPSKTLIADLICRAAQHEAVLDVGAGSGLLKSALKRRGFQGVYRSMDIDPFVSVDYRSLGEIKRTFAVIAMLDVIEHLHLQETVWYLESFKPLLTSPGLLILSTPDPSHPTWIREDISHIQHYPYKDFCAILRKSGYRHVEVYRILDLVPSRFQSLTKRWIPYIGFSARFLLTRLTGINFESRTLLFIARAANL